VLQNASEGWDFFLADGSTRPDQRAHTGTTNPLLRLPTASPYFADFAFAAFPVPLAKFADSW
jgi:hypothetical protein